MKINPTGNAGFVNSAYRNSKVELYKQNQSVSRGDKAELSDEAISFSKAFSAAKSAAGIEDSDKADRIAQIKQQLQAGTYKVSSEDVAESILGNLYG